MIVRWRTEIWRKGGLRGKDSDVCVVYGQCLVSTNRHYICHMTVDKNIELAQLQGEIGKYIGLGQNSLVFQFEEAPSGILLRLITISPMHNQSFLFHSCSGETRIEVLKGMLEYVKSYKEAESSFTIQWNLKGENILHTSYFRAKNILGALDKLYFDRDPNSITVFSVMMNPIS